MSDTDMPRLEAPGAGLPAVQEFLLRHLAFPVLKRCISRERALSLFEREGEEMLRRVRAFSAAERTRRVLVPRMMGIEDSSRYWSLDMAVEHVIIVSRAVLNGVVTLSHGKTIPVKVDTAAVKPRVDTAPDVDVRWEELMRGARAWLEKNAGDLEAGNCHVHPWFGCLNPHEWLVMLAVHQYIHRRQVAAIAKRLLVPE